MTLEWFAVVHANVISTSAMFSMATCGFAHLIMGFRGLFVRVHMLIHTHTCKLWYHNKVLFASLARERVYIEAIHGTNVAIATFELLNVL